jgi:hypothetical protein
MANQSFETPDVRLSRPWLHILIARYLSRDIVNCGLDPSALAPRGRAAGSGRLPSASNSLASARESFSQVHEIAEIADTQATSQSRRGCVAAETSSAQRRRSPKHLGISLFARRRD